MEFLRLRPMIFAGVVLLAPAHCTLALKAQTAQPAAGAAVVPYDQMSAEAKRAQADKDAPAAAPAKQPSTAAAPDSSTPASAGTTAAPAEPAATATVTPAAEGPGAETKAEGDVPTAAGMKDGGKLKKAKKAKKEKPPKLIPVNIVKGELTVDGLIAKADLNFQIIDLKYLYIWVPGLGTTVISNNPFPGAKLQANALDGNTLTVKVDDHQLQLACDHQMLEGKKPKPMPLYVALDPDYQKSSKYPEFGYGDVGKAPYKWPGSLADANTNSKAPPLPENLRQNVEKVKRCTTNPDGTQNCTYTDVPLVLGKNSKS